MRARRSWPFVLLLATACVHGGAVDDADVPPERDDVEAGSERTGIVPEGLAVSALAGGAGVLAVTALTLQNRAGQTELFAALKNVGDVPACSAAFSVELFDASGRSMAAGIGGLLTQRFYQRIDGSGAIAACVGPGEVTMTALGDLPSDLAIEGVRSLIYRCPYFALEVEPIAGVTIRDVKKSERSGRTAFEGTLVNGLKVALKNPSVRVFSLNAAGRPLGVVSAHLAAELAPSGTWMFETESVVEPGVDQRVFPAGELASD